MDTSRTKVFAGLLIVSCSLSGIAVAQAGGNSGQSGADAVTRVANLSAEAQILEGKKIVMQGDRLSRRVSLMLDDARRDADLIRITCLNEKLTQINANLRNAQKRLEALTGAVDADRRNHEYTVLTVLGQKFQTLDQESNRCVGQDIFETGATRVETDIDTSVVSNENPNEIPPVLTPAPQIPPPASGTF